MNDEEIRPRCERCMHRFHHELLPDLCTWAGTYLSEVKEEDCWYNGAPPYNQWT